MPPVAAGSVRLYHGGEDPTSGGSRWVTPNYQYARDYRAGSPTSYVDVPINHPAVQDAIISHPDEPYLQIRSLEVPDEFAKQLQPVPAPAPGAPTHMYQGPDAVYPVTPTGPEQVFTDGRVYAEVREPGKPPTWVPKDRVLPNQGEGAPVIQPPPQAVPPVEPPPPVPPIPQAPRNALAPDFVGPEAPPPVNASARPRQRLHRRRRRPQSLPRQQRPKQRRLLRSTTLPPIRQAGR